MKKLLLLPVLVFVLSGLVSAQTNAIDFKHSFGVNTKINPDQMEYYVPIWLNEKTIVSPFLAVQFNRNFETDNSSIDLGLKRYLIQPRTAAPFVNFDTGYSYNLNQGFVGLGFGGDYFISKQFSIGAELNTRYTFRDVGTRLGVGIDNFMVLPGISFGIHF